MTVRDGGRNVSDRQRVVRRTAQDRRDPYATRAAQRALDAIAGNIELVGDIEQVQFISEEAKARSEEAEGKADQALAVALDLQSDNYDPGEAGWKLERDTGNAELNDVFVRGIVESVDSYPDGSYVGTVSAGQLGLNWRRPDGVGLPGGSIRTSILDPTPQLGVGELGMGLYGGMNLGLELFDNGEHFAYGDWAWPGASGTANRLRIGANQYLSEFNDWLTVYARNADGSEGFRVRGSTGTSYQDLFQVANSGQLRARRAGWETTSSDANVRLFTGDADPARIALVTSKRAAKRDIVTADLDDERVLSLREVRFRDRAEVAEDPDAGYHLGLIAEEVEEAGFEELVSRDEHGDVQSVNYSRLAVALLPVVRRQRDALAALEARVAALEATSSAGCESEE